MSLHLDERPDGGSAFYIDGDLQFDTEDEALYHESLALPALCLAQPAKQDALRVLICGGGDGLALRECLRFPGVAHIDLVDYDAEVVALGRTRFAALNRAAFEDRRAQIHIGDAWEFLEKTPPYDVILCDFTVPRRVEDTRVFTVEWYERVRQALTDRGVAAFNAVSPQNTPEAFWCLYRTVRASGLSALPYHVCIPSFRAQGYGAWGFILASPRPLRRSQLRSFACPVETRQADLARLWRGARFARRERELAQRVPIHTLAEPCLLRLELNPGMAGPADGETSALSAPYSLDALMRAIPVSHPYHTRVMIETLAVQVVGTVRALDVQRLVEALLRRAAELPAELLRELGRLRDFLRRQVANIERCGDWSRKLFVTLVVLMTLANSIAPDNAFAKGSFGLGHASMSRGYSSFSGARGFSNAGHEVNGSFGGGEAGGGGRSASGSFGGNRGFTEGGEHTISSSFAGRRGIGSSFGENGRAASGPFSQAPAITHSGFRRQYGERPVDADGYSYTPRRFYYGGSFSHSYFYNSYNGAYNAPAQQQPAQEHKALFVADDDMLVMENGDVVITLSDSAYLLVSGATLTLFSTGSPEPLAPIYPDPNLFGNVIASLQDRQAQVQAQVGARRDWLSWVGWTAAFSSTIADDRAELRNLQDLSRRLDTALRRVALPPDRFTPITPPEPNVTELFVGAFLLDNGEIMLRTPNGSWIVTDGKTLTGDRRHTPAHCPPLLATALKSILLKLQREFAADLASTENDVKQMQTDRASLQQDMTEYQSILSQQADPDYQVDYGTDEISVSDAINRTQNSLDQNQQDLMQSQADYAKLSVDLRRVDAAAGRFGR